MKQSWSVIVFCYNETGSVREVLRLLLSIFDEHRRGAYEIIAVDDGSTDGSHQKIESMRDARPDVIRYIRHERNKGIGEALRSGYAAAQNENITAIPADGQFDVRELIPYLNVENNTFISFYRLENAEYTALRNILSGINKKINQYLIGVRLKDVNWVKIYKRRDVQSLTLQLHSSLVESEICAKLIRSGIKPTEVISYYHARIAGQSKGASLPIVMKALRETLRLIVVMWHFRPRNNSVQ